MYANTKTVVEKELGDKPALKPPVSPPKESRYVSWLINAQPSAGGPSTSPNPPTPATPASDTSAQAQPPPQTPTNNAHLPYARALHSPKVLTECPIAVVLIFQTWKDKMKSAMLDFYPLVMDSIKIQPEPQKKAHADAKERGEVFVGVADGIQNREMFTELIKAQVKVSINLSRDRLRIQADIGRPWPFLLMYYEAEGQTIITTSKVTWISSRKPVSVSSKTVLRTTSPRERLVAS